MTQLVTSGCTGQISAVTFFALQKAAIKNLLGEPGVMRKGRGKRKGIVEFKNGAASASF